ncbi:RcpC/CpaB family pilus assembly protein [Sinomonas sp. ASV322]|uniref:Flp pilus assembly protein CpaB n=1 Tax=Sinomonas sp. ASV322 TaxID=3041920 RepID=UPI0027DCA371|nr:RcpC/CpaB family pilus assembly protein [Sinomonas sp. ASV322]MDQ4501877.1 RcpC/CpaB family pilus assembly protein [Sinomonas sp. ASV322]
MAALIVAIIGTVLLLTYVSGADRRALANVDTVDVYVVQKEIPAGTPASSLSDYATKKPLPKSAVPENPVTDLASIQGKVASIALKPGEELLASRFTETAALQTPGRVAVPAGMQEVTIKLPMERVVGGNIAAGDTVGIVVSLPKEEPLPAQTQMTFNKVLVTAVQMSNGAVVQSSSSVQTTTTTPGQGALNANGASSNAPATGDYLVTLARPASDIERIVFAMQNGQVYLTKEPASATDGTSAPVDRAKVLR